MTALSTSFFQSQQEDEFCESDATCDQGLFCDISSGRCAEKSGEGQPCHFLDPSEPDPGTETLPCKEYLTCNPFEERCVAYCKVLFCQFPKCI